MFTPPEEWILATCVIAIACLPGILHLLGLTCLICRGKEDPAGVEPPENDPAYAAIFGELRMLGFKPLGSYRQYACFFYFHWLKVFSTRVFFSPEHGCYASVYRLVQGDTLRVAISSCFRDGALVQTSNALERFPIHERDWVRTGFVTCDLGRLVALHRQIADRFAAEGHQPDREPGFSKLMAAVQRVSRRFVRRDRQTAQGFLCFIAGIVVGVPFMITMYRGGNWTVFPTAVLACGGVLLLLRILLPLGIQNKRKQELARGPNLPPGGDEEKVSAEAETRNES